MLEIEKKRRDFEIFLRIFFQSQPFLTLFFRIRGINKNRAEKRRNEISTTDNDLGRKNKKEKMLKD